MSIANVDLTNSFEYFRIITNQCILALNYITNNAYITTGNITINPPSPVFGLVSLNVASGLISGNGAKIFSIPVTNLLGKIQNNQLQNSSIAIITGKGMSGGGTPIESNVGTIHITSNPINSITNTRTDLPAAANAIQLLLRAALLVSKTVGRFGINVGGTNIVSYANGQLLFSNSGNLIANTIASGQGILVTNGAGSIVISAALRQGDNILLTQTGTSGIIISQNTPPVANTSVAGIARLNDTITSSSLTEVPTSNSLNAVNNLIRSDSGVSNVYGRLTNVAVYFKDYTNPAGNNISFVWSKPDTSFSFAVVTILGEGGGGSSANNNNVATDFVVGTGGGAGAAMVGMITENDLFLFGDDAGANNLTINFEYEESDINDSGKGGSTSSANAGNPGRNGCNVIVGRRGSSSTFLFKTEGGRGGPTPRIIANVGLGGSSGTYYGIAKPYANNQYGTVLMKTVGISGRLGVVVQRGTGMTTPYRTTAWGGSGGIPMHPFASGGYSSGLRTLNISNEAWCSNGGSSGGSTDNTEAGINGAGPIYDPSTSFEDLGSVGVGGGGALSCGSAAGATGTDQAGGRAGGAYVRIETYSKT